MKLILKKCAIGVLAALLASCGGSGDAPPAQAPSGPLFTVDPSTAASLSGAVRFEGPAPAPVRSSLKSFSECAHHHKGDVWVDDAVISDGKLANVFVYVKSGLEGKNFAVPSEPKLLDQAGCLYVPHVLGIQTNQTLTIKNSDVSLHNVHSHSVNQRAFNLGMPVQGMKLQKTFASPEVMIKFTCDVHPWMKSYLGVLPHPYYAVSAADGSFAIPNLPPGEYVIEAWHEKFGAKSQTVTLAPSESKTLSFSFSQ